MPLLKRPTAIKPLSWFKGILHQMIGNSTIAGLMKKKKKTFWFGPSDDPVISEALKLPFFTTAHALNHWSKDKMMAFIS